MDDEFLLAEDIEETASLHGLPKVKPTSFKTKSSQFYRHANLI